MPGITDPTEAYFKDGQWGWDGTQWRKLPLGWGYSERWHEQIYGVASGAGDATGTSATITSGYVYVIQAFAAFHDAGVDKHLTISATDAANPMPMLDDPTATTNKWYYWSGTLVLCAGDTITAHVAAPGDGKAVWCRIRGYKMKITE